MTNVIFRSKVITPHNNYVCIIDVILKEEENIAFKEILFHFL